MDGPRCGLYALIDLAGETPDAANLAALGLTQSPHGIALRVFGQGASESTILRDAARSTVLLGHIDDSARVAEELGIGVTASSAELARSALDCWQATVPARLPGEWTMLDWRHGVLTLIQSAACWTKTFYARQGSRIAIGGDVFTLSNISWIGGELDETGLLSALGRSSIRAQAAGRTVLAGVKELLPGECIRFAVKGTDCSINLPYADPADWTGSFEQAVEETRALLAQIVSERLSRHGDVACLLSGGLDSSLIAMFVSQSLRAGQSAICLTSVAPPGSGLADEQELARTVAGSLGLEVMPVVPGPFPGIYAPDASAFYKANGPSLSARHYLYYAFGQEARNRGLTGIFDGVYGEMSVTGQPPAQSLGRRLRQVVKRLLRRDDPPDPALFHVRLAPHRLRTIPDFTTNAPQFPGSVSARRDNAKWGYFEGVEKAWERPACFTEGMVTDYPFRDPRLLEHFSNIPANYLLWNGIDRAIGREIMRGWLPDSIRLQGKGLPFSPDYWHRLKAEAPSALARVPAFRKLEIDDWLDLDWLEVTLARIAADGPSNIAAAFEAQTTAMAAEFLVWWRAGERKT